jgi:hypothetical protein
VIGDEADPKVKRLPRVDRMALQVARLALGQTAPDGLALVAGTHYGGLSATVDFLEGLATRGPAFGSPTAFHQSVHHSPAGQVSISLKLTGPTLTCSAREITGEAALRAGVDLLRMKRCEKVLVLCADEVVPALEAAFRALEAPWHPAEGAAALLLGREGGEVEVADVTLGGRALPMLAFSEPPPAGAAINPAAGLIAVIEAARALASRPSGETVALKSYALGGGEARVELRRR